MFQEVENGREERKEREMEMETKLGVEKLCAQVNGCDATRPNPQSPRFRSGRRQGRASSVEENVRRGRRI